MFRLLEHHLQMERLDRARDAMLDRLLNARPCFMCRRTFSPSDAGAQGDTPLVLCSDCGARRRQDALEELGWTELFVRYARRMGSLPLLPKELRTRPEPVMTSDLVRFCARGCGQQLRRHNTKDVCKRCSRGGGKRRPT